MKGFIGSAISFVVIIGLFVGAVNILFPRPCVTPLEYRIGSIDPRFHLSQEKFQQDIARAGSIWEKEVGKQLFAFNPNAEFAINVKYDDRQKTTDTVKAFTAKLSEVALEKKGIQEEYVQLYEQYVSAQKTYQKNIASYEADRKAFNNRIAEYNEDGGTSEEQYNALQSDQEVLQTRGRALEQERLALNVLADKVNGVAKKDGQIVKKYNERVQQFNDTFARHREFDQGEYAGNEINIYEFSTHSDLVAVLEHELGHALGIRHVENPASVMYYLVNGKNVNTRGLSKEDKKAVAEACSKTSFEIFGERLREGATAVSLSYR